MATVNREIALVIVQNDGIYPGDQCYAVVRYENDFDGQFAYAICYTIEEYESVYKSPAVHNPVDLWTKWGGLTFEGLTWTKWKWGIS